jgi:WD40 repeat protein
MMLRAFEGHTATIHSISFSNDENRIVSGSADQSVRIWDALVGGLIKVLDGHTASVYAVAFSRDCSWIVSGSADQTVRVWDAAVGAVHQVLEGHTASVYSVAFSTDGNLIASGSGDQSIRLWDVWTGEVLAVLHGHTASVSAVAFGGDNNRIVSGSFDHSLRIWDISTTSCHRPEYQLGFDMGWLQSTSGERLMFVPQDAKLPDSQNILTIPPSMASTVDFSQAALGPNWHQCYGSIDGPSSFSLGFE